jgi:hypothetical protein
MPDPKGRPVYTRGPVVRHLQIGYLFLAVGVVLGLWLSYHAQVREQNLSECISSWANRSTARTTAVTRANLARQTDLDNLIIAAIRKDTARARRLVPTYIRDVRAYRKALKAHPIPTSPKLVC